MCVCVCVCVFSGGDVKELEKAIVNLVKSENADIKQIRRSSLTDLVAVAPLRRPLQTLGVSPRISFGVSLRVSIAGLF